MTRHLLLTILAACHVCPANAQQAASGWVSGAALHHMRQYPLYGLAVSDESQVLERLYLQGGDTLLWKQEGLPSRQARALIDIVAGAESYGLTPNDYGYEDIVRQASSLSPSSSQEDWVRFDVALSTAAIRFVSHLHYGRVDPRKAGYELNEPRNDINLAGAVANIASASDVKEAIAALEPHFHHYALLKAALAKYLALERDGPLPILPMIGTRRLRPGDSYAAAPALRRSLEALEDMPQMSGNSRNTGLQLDAALMAALKHYQARHGLDATGVLDSGTLAELNVPLKARVEQIGLTLERWRWLPVFTTPPIIVNIPAFRLFAFRTVEDRATSILQMDVIVGRSYPSTQTPVFVGEMTYVDFRPYWNIPRSITMHEMLPHIRRNFDYLAQHELEIVRGQSDAAVALPPTQATIDGLISGESRLRQRPGTSNALGLVKFMFPNQHNVYLHSTPAPQLFLTSRRAFSHGCIRVKDPVALAAFVLRNTPGQWDPDHVRAAMQGANASRIDLNVPISVMILYGTAQATEAGEVQFFADIYGHDQKLITLLRNARTVNAASSIMSSQHRD